MTAEPAPSDASPPVWFVRGARGVVSVPAVILMTSFIGFGVLCRETGLSLGEAMFMTGIVWALPGQVVLVGAIGAGASLPVAALAVALSAVRLTPMVAAWVPVVRSERTPVWRLLALSHFVAVTAWVWGMLRLPALPPAARAPYFAGFGTTLTLCGMAVTGLSYVATGALPPVLAGALFFLTPIYFVTALTAAARIDAERIALAAGLAFGPLFQVWGVALDLLWAGLIGGTLAFALHRAIRRRA
jgi:predicted branched-subunit amino acid permease